MRGLPDHMLVEATTRNRFKVLSSLRHQIMLASFSMLLPLIILAGSGYYIYLSTVDSFDAVLDDVFLQVLPTGELRELLFQISLPVSNHLISSNREEKEKYEKFKQHLNMLYADLVDLSDDDASTGNKNNLLRSYKEWQAAEVYSDKLVLYRDQLSEQEATDLFNKFHEHHRASIENIVLFQHNTNQDIINKHNKVAKQLEDVQFLSVLSTLAAFMVAFLITYFFIRNVVAPLQVIETGAEKFGGGDFHTRLAINSRNELGKLAMTFNSMADKLEEIATRDSLTGLLNKKEILRILEAELERARRHAENVSVMMLDLDFFKDINDTYGHQTGDNVLVAIARVIDKHVRGIDYVGRYGGEEFLIVLPATSMAESSEIAERIRRSLAATPITVSKSEEVHLTISIGIAFYPGDSEEQRALLSYADQALYHAKAAGRNQVVHYSSLAD
jgi:diguanylate cyclase (GGDEF)-like protein